MTVVDWLIGLNDWRTNERNKRREEKKKKTVRVRWTKCWIEHLRKLKIIFPNNWNSFMIIRKMFKRKLLNQILYLRKFSSNEKIENECGEFLDQDFVWIQMFFPFENLSRFKSQIFHVYHLILLLLIHHYHRQNLPIRSHPVEIYRNYP